MGALGNDDGEGLTVLGRAALAFASCEEIQTIVITIPPGAEEEARMSLPRGLLASRDLLFVSGGSSRRASVHRALVRLESEVPPPLFVLIHDGARPWVEKDLIQRTIQGLIRYGAVIPLVPLAETPKEMDSSGFIKRHLRRASLGAAQTPQGFAFPAILRAHERAAEREEREGFEYTDDAEVWAEFLGPVAFVPGSPANRKITFPEDLG